MPPVVAPLRAAPRTIVAAETEPTMPPTTPPHAAGPAVDEEAGDDADDDRAEQRAREPEAKPGEHARERDARGDADPDGDPDQPHSVSHAYPCRRVQCTDGPALQPPNHVDAEGSGAGAVDDAVVEGDRDVPHLAHDDLAVSHDRARPDAVKPEDRDLRVVDQRRHEEAAELAGARDRERRVAQLVGLERAGARTLGEPVDLGVDLGDREPVAATDDRHDEARLGVDGDAEVVAVEQHDLVVVDPRVELGELCERAGRCPQRRRDEEVEVDAGEVALLDERHGRDLAVRALDLLDDRAPDAAHRHPAPFERGSRGANVGLGDAAARARCP